MQNIPNNWWVVVLALVLALPGAIVNVAHILKWGCVNRWMKWMCGFAGKAFDMVKSLLRAVRPF